MAEPWLKRKAPGLHRFWTRQDKPYPLLRETAVGAGLIVVLLGGLFVGTGQPFPGGSPVVVVTSGSMMHCTNGHPPLGRDCDPTIYGRIGSIDPGDLVFVQRVARVADVATKAQDAAGSYGQAGDVVVYHRSGSTLVVPVIHRALFYLQVNADGTVTVADLGISHAPPRLDQAAAVELAGCVLGPLPGQTWQPADSGFITRGDNNPAADQCPTGPISGPARLDWLVGKARGEVPWVGLIKLFVDDLRSGTTNFGNAGNDSKVMLAVALAAIVGAPYALRAVRRRTGREPGPEPPAPPQP